MLENFAEFFFAGNDFCNFWGDLIKSMGLLRACRAEWTGAARVVDATGDADRQTVGRTVRTENRRHCPRPPLRACAHRRRCACRSQRARTLAADGEGRPRRRLSHAAPSPRTARDADENANAARCALATDGEGRQGEEHSSCARALAADGDGQKEHADGPYTRTTRYDIVPRPSYFRSAASPHRRVSSPMLPPLR